MTPSPLPSRWPLLAAAAAICAGAALGAQSRPAQPDWPSVEAEALGHYQALIRFDTSGTERAAAEYLAQVLGRQGIETRVFAKDPERPNVVARLRGSGRKRPLLLMGHLDTVPVDASKWRFPPFSATRDEGYVYGRGASTTRTISPPR
jgi:acetylornithine deacetylase/succinyl-diaminopimelate desuccinylase-like protein